MARWTEKQEEAISTRNANLLVSAAAGSGKTAILVERIIRLLTKEKASIDEFLIVTFTNAAAAEMRERIFAAIARELENSAGQDAHLRKQLQLLGQSSISTLHAFCIGIIRKHYHVLGLDPRFRVGDTAELTLLRKKGIGGSPGRSL